MVAYGAIAQEGSSHRDMRSYHRQAIAAVGLVSAVVLLAAGYAGTHQGQRAGLLSKVEGHLPFAELKQLARNHKLWSRQAAHRENILDNERKNVGSKLAKDMKKLWAAKSMKAKESDLKQVEIMKGRYEALEAAMSKAPVLKQLPQVRSNEMHVMDPRTGKVYALYEYHVPGGYEDAELDLHPTFAKDLKGIAPFEAPADRNEIYQGVYPDYPSVRGSPQALYEYHVPGGYEDAELDLHPTLAKDLKGIAPFEAPADRNEIYQGVYPEYPSVRGSPQALYEYHVPGGYEDAELDLHPTLAKDLKGIAPFEAPADRSEIYQGVYPDYPSVRSNPQALYEDGPIEANAWLANDQKGSTPFEDPAGRNPIYQGVPPVYPEFFVVMDNGGQLRLISAAAVRGMEQARMAEEEHLGAQQEWAKHAAEVRAIRARENKEAHEESPVADKLISEAVSVAPKTDAPHKSKAALKARLMSLSQKFATSSGEQWGTIYEPKPVNANSDDANPLEGEGKSMFKHWNSLATQVNDVYDPAKDHSAANNFGAHGGTWWENGKGDDQWWTHDHAGRGY